VASWDDAVNQIARALSAIQARDSALRGASTTLDLAILEAVVDLDSDQSDAVATLGAGNFVEYTDDGNVRQGQLQKISALEATFFGDTSTGQTSMIAALRALPDPNKPDQEI